MKVKELAELVGGGYDFFVEHNGEDIKGDSSLDFLDCELEIKHIRLACPECLIIET